MNHEQRIKNLEKQITKLQKIIEAAGLNQEYLPISQAAKYFGVNPWVIRDRIKNDCSLQVNKHFRLNGSRYLINIRQWQKLIENDLQIKRNF
jgi:hypothetical protein